jgi:hypothetical protein
MANILYYEDIQLVDGVKGFFGTGEDMEIYHNGSSSVINNNTGDFIIKTSVDNGDIYFQADNGSGGIATYFYLDGSLVNGSSVLGATRFPDKSKIYIGSGGDLEIFHNGSQTYIENYTGEFNFTQHTNDGDMIFKCDDGSGGVTAYLTLDGGLGYTTVQKDIRFEDNVQLELGDGRDLTIYSDGTNGLISNQNGSLYITQAVDDEDIILSCDNGSGGTTAYLTLDGSLTQMWADKDLQFSDNIKAKFGASSDLQIYHNGTNSLIENSTGHLYISNYADDKQIIFQNDDGSGGVETYFYLDGLGGGSQPFTVFPDAAVLAMGSNHDTYIQHTGAHMKIDNYTGNFEISNQADDGDLSLRCDDGSGGSKTYIKLDGGIATTLVYTDLLMVNDGNDGKIKLGASQDLQIYHDGSNSYIRDAGTGNLYIDATSSIIFRDYGSAEEMAKFINDGAIELYHDNAKKFETFSNGIKLTNTEGTQIHFVESDSTYTESMRIIRYQDVLGFHYGDNASEEAFTIDNTGQATAHKNLTVLGGNITLSGTGRIQGIDTVSAATDAASKAYVDNLTTGVLTYQGTWNASTNSPTLSSGSGTPGYYYIVSVAGSTNLDGITDWAVGDWAVFSDQATDAWQKIDNTAVGNVSGSGANNRLTLWSGTGTVDSDANFYMSGTTLYTPNLTTTGDITVGDDVFIADSGIINLGSGNDMILFHDGADAVIRNNTGHIYFDNFASDKDINVRGNDGGVTITALSLDMSAGGQATFNRGITAKTSTAGDWGLTLNTSNGDNMKLSVADTGTAGAADGKLSVSDGDFIVDASGDITLDADGGDVFLKDAGSTFGTLQHSGFDFIIKAATNDKDIKFNGFDNGSGITALTLDMSSGGTATFNNELYIPNYIYHVGDANTYFGFAGADNIKLVNGGNTALHAHDNGNLYLYGGGGTTLTLDTSQNATFAGRVDVTSDVNIQAGALSITSDGANKATFTETGAGLLTIETQDDLVLDAASDIILDATGDDIRLRVNGTEFGKFNNASSNLNIYSSIQDKDIVFWGNDAGSSITALTLDMSEGGNATFAGDVITGKVGNAGSGSNITFSINGMSWVTGSGTMSMNSAGTLSLSHNLLVAGINSTSDITLTSSDLVLSGDSNIVLDTSVSSTQSSGTIIKIGSHMSSLVAGNIYYAGNSMGNLYWYGADADSSSTENMLALSVGTDADVDGMLLNGIYHKASHGLTVGEPIYLSTTSMAMTNTAPSGANDYVRVLGYALDSNHIYFCPDNTWVKISS